MYRYGLVYEYTLELFVASNGYPEDLDRPRELLLHTGRKRESRGLG